MTRKEISIIGLGKIGSSLVENFCSNNYQVFGFDINKGIVLNSDKNLHLVSSIRKLISITKSPRLIFLALPSGNVNSLTINRLLPLIQASDTVIDMSNSYFNAAEEFEKKYSFQGKFFIDVGISGGVLGARNGPSLMVGNKKNVSKPLANALNKISAKYKGKPCVGYYKKPGNGHFVKMLHNFLEYTEMQLIAEVITCLSQTYNLDDEKILIFIKKLRLDDKSSYLLKITEKIFKEKILKPNKVSSRNLTKHNGTAKWAAQLSLEIEAYTPSLFSALLERLSLSQIETNSTITRRKNKTKIKLTSSKISSLLHSYTISRSSIYLQLNGIIFRTNKILSNNIDPYVVASNWSNGSIVKSDFLRLMSLTTNEFFLAPKTRLQEKFSESFSKILCDATQKSIAIPVMYSSWQYLQNYESQIVTSEIVGRQRLIFGGHQLYELTNQDS